MNQIIFGDNLPFLKEIPDESIDLIYIDPPFNTGKVQKLKSIKTVRSDTGDRTGFKGQKYETYELGSKEYDDKFGSDQNGHIPRDVVSAYHILSPESSIGFLEEFLRPRLVEARRILKPNGSLYFHIDYREVHYCKLLLDNIFGRESFVNEIIWAYDFGGRAKSRWPAKHDTILFYVKNPKNFVFNTNEIDRERYMAPGLVGKEKEKRGKLPTDTWFWPYVEKKKVTDTWWQTIVGTNSKARTGYPTQKPIELLERIIRASCPVDGTVLDFFAGSGTTGEACIKTGRSFVLIDSNLDALRVMAARFFRQSDIDWKGFDPKPIQNKITPKIERIILRADKRRRKPSEDFQKLASAASYLQKDLEEKSDFWKESPFNWILELPARKKGKLGRELITAWLQDEGFAPTKAVGTGEAIVIDDIRFSIKFSTLWTSGSYRFQQIRNHGYENLICLGISPFEAHCWIIPKKIAINHGKLQHTGGKEFWFTVKPHEQEDWISNYGGSLKKAIKVVRKLIK